MKSEIALTPKGPVEYTLLGDGPIVLVCHGTSSNCFSTEISQPLIEAGFRVLTPSRPGYGRTPLDAGRTASAAAATFGSLLDTLGVATCAVEAISGGGPTGIALAAGFPKKVTRLVLAEAISHPEARPNEAGYKDQLAFYGPLHPLMWAMLGLMSRLSPKSTARQTLAIFSSHNPADAVARLSADEIRGLCRFFHSASSRKGALADLAHTVAADALQSLVQPTLVIHSREDTSVPFAHAEWALAHIPHAELCEAGFTGHFFWIGPDFTRISQRTVAFLSRSDE